MLEKTVFVGDRPEGQTTFEIRNQNSGVVESLTSFHTARVFILDSDDNVLEFPDENTVIFSAAEGLVRFFWPSESVFTKPGRYLLQVRLEGNTIVRSTTMFHIICKPSLGGVLV